MQDKKPKGLSAHKAREVLLSAAPTGLHEREKHISSLQLSSNSVVEVESKSLI